MVVAEGGPPADVIAEARAAGRNNLPPSTALQLSGPENAIRAEHERQHLALAERVRGQLRELDAAFTATEQQLSHPDDLEAVVDDAEAKLRDELGDERSLVPERRAQQSALRDLRHLVDERGITRPPRYPKSKRLHLAWVAVLATLEAVGNAAFFAGISTIGWVGGLGSAFVLATVNTGSAVLVGYTCLRGLHHHRVAMKRLSAVGLAAYCILVLAFNIAAGRARDLAIAGALTTQGFAQLLAHPFQLSLLSTALVGLGLVSVAIALAKGASLDEPIPHYGHLHRRHLAADESFARAGDETRARLLAHIHSIPNRLRVVVDGARLLLERLEATVVAAEKAVEAYESARQHLVAACERLLREFRTVNERVRSTPAPAYFQTFPNFPSQVDAGTVQAMRHRLAAAHHRLDELRAEAHRLEAAQPERIRDAVQRFKKFHDQQLHRADAGRGESSDDGGQRTDGARS